MKVFLAQVAYALIGKIIILFLIYIVGIWYHRNWWTPPGSHHSSTHLLSSVISFLNSYGRTAVWCDIWSIES